MAKEYVKPIMEEISFNLNDDMADLDPSLGGSGIEGGLGEE